MTGERVREGIVTGVAEAVNEKGVRLRGEGEWRNYTKAEWRHKPFEEVRKGDEVEMTVDKDGFVRAVRVLGGAHAGSGEQSAVRGPHSAYETSDVAGRIARATALNVAGAVVAAWLPTRKADAPALTASEFAVMLLAIASKTAPWIEHGDAGEGG